jgi:hypothetical protein
LVSLPFTLRSRSFVSTFFAILGYRRHVGGEVEPDDMLSAGKRWSNADEWCGP